MFIKRMKLTCKTQGSGGAKGDLSFQPPPLGPGPEGREGTVDHTPRIAHCCSPHLPTPHNPGETIVWRWWLTQHPLPSLGFRSSKVCSVAAQITHAWNALEFPSYNALVKMQVCGKPKLGLHFEYRGFTAEVLKLGCRLLGSLPSRITGQ